MAFWGYIGSYGPRFCPKAFLGAAFAEAAGCFGD